MAVQAESDTYADGQGSSPRHLGDAFKPDSNSSNFKKPTREMNIASGCPVFVVQTVLVNRTYIKDDTILIKVIVDTSDLPDPLQETREVDSVEGNSSGGRGLNRSAFRKVLALRRDLVEQRKQPEEEEKEEEEEVE